MTTYKVESVEDVHYVRGLRGHLGDADTALVVTYAEGDCDTVILTSETMLAVLYDLFQTHDALKNGDTFETPFGNFVCSGVHVVASKP